MNHDPEFCKRVAEEIGLRADVQSGICFSMPSTNTLLRGEFRPDVDWNDAMFAAECFGLWEGQGWPGIGYAKMVLIPEWKICPCHSMRNWEPVVENKSGPRAICEAILKLR